MTLLRLFALFSVVPALELYLLLQIGSFLGPAPTLLLIVVTGALGAALARHEGVSVLREIAQAGQAGRPPTRELVEGGLILAGGLLLMTPGVVTDFVGFSLVFPLTRRTLAPAIIDAVASRVRFQTMNMDFGQARSGMNVDFGQARPGPMGPGPRMEEPPKPGGSPASPFDHPVV